MSHISHTITDFEIQEDLPDHHFRTEIPNLIFDIGLAPNQLIVYMTLKRIAGDNGACWKSIKSLATQCGLGETAVRTALNHLSLEDSYQIDDECIHLDKPLIEIIKRKRKDGGDDTSVIRINSIWKVNGDFYRKKKKKSMQGGGSPNEGGGFAKRRGGGSRGEPKEEQQYKKNQTKKQQQAPTNGTKVCDAAVVFYKCLEEISLTKKQKDGLMKYPESEVKDAVAFAIHPSTNIKTTLIQTIIWALKEKPDVPETVDAKANEKYANLAESTLKSDHWKLDALSKKLMCYSDSPGNSTCYEILYTETKFKEKLDKLLKDKGFKIKKDIRLN